MKRKLLELKYDFGIKTNKYFYRQKGDTSRFRYPQLKNYSKYFDSDLKNDIFILKRHHSEAIKMIGKEITPIYKNLNKKANYVNTLEILGYTPSYLEKHSAYKSIKKSYRSNKLFKSYSIKKIDFNKAEINEGYESLNRYINRCLNNTIYLCQIDSNFTNNLNYSLHGTNIVYTDSKKYNYGVSLINAIINTENGIKGYNLENLSIDETLANVKYQYLLYVLDKPDIKNNSRKQILLDIDKFFLKGYLAKAFINEDTYYNGIYSLIEPYIKLLFTVSDIDMICESVIKDNINDLKKKFDLKYNNFFDSIYKNPNLFTRIDKIKDLSLENNMDLLDIYRIMFNENKLVNSPIDHKVIAFIHLSEKTNQNTELIYNLIYECYNWAIDNNQTINLENWSKHVLLKYGEQTHKMLLSEYEKYKNIIENL